MQLVLSNNRVIAHGENFLAMGGTVINTATGAKYENATVAECDGCPSDIDSVGYEYHAGVFKPCAPFGKGNNNGYFMEVCETCATPRSSGIPIKKGIKLENLNEEVTAEALVTTGIKLEHLHSEVTAEALGAFDSKLLWTNASPTSNFAAQTISLSLTKYARLKILFINCYADGQPKYIITEITKKNVYFTLIAPYGSGSESELGSYDYEEEIATRKCKFTNTGVVFGNAYRLGSSGAINSLCIPYQIIGYEHL